WRFVERLLAPRLHEGLEHQTSDYSRLEVPAERVEACVACRGARLEVDDLVASGEPRNALEELVIVLGLIAVGIDEACGNSQVGVATQQVFQVERFPEVGG